MSTWRSYAYASEWSPSTPAPPSSLPLASSSSSRYISSTPPPGRPTHHTTHYPPSATTPLVPVRSVALGGGSESTPPPPLIARGRVYDATPTATPAPSYSTSSQIRARNEQRDDEIYSGVLAHRGLPASPSAYRTPHHSRHHATIVGEDDDTMGLTASSKSTATTASSPRRRLVRRPSMVHDPYAAMIPPQAPEFRGKLVVVLDLDETLVYAREGPVITRPGCAELLRTCRELGCEVLVWTAGERDYAQDVLRRIDPDSIVQHCVYRHHKWWSGQAGYRKDLANLGRAMELVLFVDNTPDCLRGHERNSILVSDFNNRGRGDNVLFTLANFIRTLDKSPLPVPDALAQDDAIVQRRVPTDVGDYLTLFTLSSDRNVEGSVLTRVNHDLPSHSVVPQPRATTPTPTSLHPAAGGSALRSRYFDNGLDVIGNGSYTPRRLAFDAPKTPHAADSSTVPTLRLGSGGVGVYTAPDVPASASNRYPYASSSSSSGARAKSLDSGSGNAAVAADDSSWRHRFVAQSPATTSLYSRSESALYGGGASKRAEYPRPDYYHDYRCHDDDASRASRITPTRVHVNSTYIRR
eukprot:PhM_4_TR3135/c1_g1_i1/m.18118